MSRGLDGFHLDKPRFEGGFKTVGSAASPRTAPPHPPLCLPPQLLDLCSGMGSWSIGFYRQGFECTGLDILDVGYPYRLIIDDVRHWKPCQYFDVIVASPPCTEFSELLFLSIAKKQRGPGNPEKGMELVRACLRIIEEVRPRFWVIENVRGAIKYFEPLLGPPKLTHRPWYLWGNFPPFLLPRSNLGRKTRVGSDGRINSDVKFNPLISWKRARIPLPLSITLAEACKRELECPS